jgi:hypothetical protein
MNIELMQEIQKRIVDEPLIHDQRRYMDKDNDCGTTYCIAGLAILIGGSQEDKEYLQQYCNDEDSGHFYGRLGEIARQILDIPAIVSTILFNATLTHENSIKLLDFLIHSNENNYSFDEIEDYSINLRDNDDDED